MRFLSLEVVLEFDEAIAVYEEQRPDRGARFSGAVRSVFARIAEAPLAFPRSRLLRRPILRRAKVLRFPYSVLYYLHRGEPIIVAIAHGKRTPSYWRERLR